MSNRGQDRGRGRGRGDSVGGGGGRGGYQGGGGGGGGRARGSSPGGGDRGGPRGGARGGGGGRGFQRGGSPGGGGGGGATGPSAYSDAPLIFNPSPNTPTVPDARIAQSDSLIRTLRSNAGSTRGPEHPVRPGWGTAGKAIVVRANFFAITVKNPSFWEYSVKITPEPKSQKARVKRRILEIFENSDAGLRFKDGIVHDGSQRLLACRPLPQPLVGKVRYFEKDPDGKEGPHPNADEYEVEVEFGRELPTAPLKNHLEGTRQRPEDIDPLISAINLIMQRQASQTGFRFGRNRYFFSDSEARSLGPRLWALMGFFTSVRPVYKQLMVNLNVCMTAFYEPGNLYDAWTAFNSGSLGANPNEFLVEAKISTKHMGYKRLYTVRRVYGNKTAARQEFNCEEFGGKITVKDYYKRKYNITLQHPDDLPCVDVGIPGKPTYLPAELCNIERGEPHLGRLSSDEITNMLRYASRRPAVNATLITQRGLGKMGLLPSTPVLDSFGVEVSGNMAIVPARELPPPSITYKQGGPRVQGGSWNIMNVQFHVGCKMDNWKVLVVREPNSRFNFNGANDPRMMGLLQAFKNKCSSSGMRISNNLPQILPTPLLPSRSEDPERLRALKLVENTIAQFGDLKKVDLILVLLSNKDDFIYPGIKRLTAVQFGVHTQCVLLPNALKTEGRPDHDRKLDQYLSNVALKVNTKLGGINHRLGPDAMKWLTKSKTMMVGIDVTHPGPSSVRGTPSIAAVVASVDDDFVQFPASLRLQKSKQEGITALADMMVERLHLYRQRNRTLPARILIFRDGVSEGQYDSEVLGRELPRIFEAFKKIDPSNPKYHPKLSIIICGKRHHARFYATDSVNADKNGNTKAGTVLDKGVTAIFDFDFYLQAHAGLQGTVRPTHYVVLYDENGLAADEIQVGIHTASYAYARATKAVSLVPPAYYADVVCEMARYWIHGFLNQGDGVSSSGEGSQAGGSSRGGRGGRGGGRGGGETAREAAERRVYEAAVRMWGNGLHPNLKDSMFYL